MNVLAKVSDVFLEQEGEFVDKLTLRSIAEIFESIGTSREKEFFKILRSAAVRNGGACLVFPNIKRFMRPSGYQLGLIFNPPCTIVYWEDDTKTVVKCHEDTPFDVMEGLRWAVLKKMFGGDKELWKFIKGSFDNKSNKYENWMKAMLKKAQYQAPIPIPAYEGEAVEGCLYCSECESTR